MADNLNFNEGIGPKKVATDDIAGTHYQQMKLVDGTLDSSAVIPGSATKGLFVDPHLATVRLQITPVISNAVAYATGDALGPIQTVANAVRVSGGSGKLLAITVLDKTQAQRAAIDFQFFDRTVTTVADNAVYSGTSDADAVFCLGVIPVATGDYNTAWAGTPANNVATKVLATPLPFTLNGTSLFFQAIVRGTPTYTSTSDIVISLLIQQD